MKLNMKGISSAQKNDINRFKKIEKRHIPDKIDYLNISGISREAAEKLSKIRPESIGQASRIPGISFCDLSLLAVHVERLSRLKD